MEAYAFAHGHGHGHAECGVLCMYVLGTRWTKRCHTCSVILPAMVQLSVAKGKGELKHETKDFCTGQQGGLIWQSAHNWKLFSLFIHVRYPHTHVTHNAGNAGNDRDKGEEFPSKDSDCTMEGSLPYSKPAHAAIQFLPKTI